MRNRLAVACVTALHVTVAWAANATPLNQAGAGELARICSTDANKGSSACIALRRECENASKAAPGAAPAACREQPVAAGVAPEPKKVPNPRVFPEALSLDVAACQQDGASCVMLSDFEARYKAGFKVLSAWCLTRALERDVRGLDERGRRAAGLVCGAISETTDANLGALTGIPVSYLFVLEKSAAREEYQCDGFALTVPFVRVRYPTKDESSVSGPVAAGIGGGYYWAPTCRPDWSWGFDLFGYSEGIDITNKRLQFGVAAGVGIVVYEQLRLGIDVGYDLYRQEPDASGAVVRNGLFGFKDYGRPSLSYLFTFSFQAKSPKSKTQPE